MSEADAVRFIGVVGASAALQREVDSFNGKGALSKLVNLGAEQGFVFTEDEYRAAVVSLADGALSDESLDQVLRDAGFQQ